MDCSANLLVVLTVAFESLSLDFEDVLLLSEGGENGKIERMRVGCEDGERSQHFIGPGRCDLLVAGEQKLHFFENRTGYGSRRMKILLKDENLRVVAGKQPSLITLLGVRWKSQKRANRKNAKRGWSGEEDEDHRENQEKEGTREKNPVPAMIPR